MKSILFLALVVATAFGHSFMSVPSSRTNQGQSQTGCRGPSCVGPCDGSNARVVGTLARGQTFPVKWPRNNHPGGFIRFAWAPTSESNSHNSFDTRIQEFTCHEKGTQAGGVCAPGNGNDPNGGDSNDAGNPNVHCAHDVTVPNWVSDGQWTLQWAWFGGGFALGDYYSCADFNIAGGNAFEGTIPGAAFKGGDFANPGGSVCKTFNTDALHRCKNEPCDNPVFNGIKSIAPAGVGQGGSTPPPVNPPVTPTPNGNGNCFSDPSKAVPASGPISFECGKNGLRCADNMCCSKYGYCGATAEYCQENQGDWRLTPCTGGGGMCYNGKDNLRLDGFLSRNGRCGDFAIGARCADGLCCSQYGFCGTTADHCNNNRGDWRLVACTPTNNIAPRDGIYSNSSIDDALDFNSNAEKIALGLLSAAALAAL